MKIRLYHDNNDVEEFYCMKYDYLDMGDVVDEDQFYFSKYDYLVKKEAESRQRRHGYI